MANKGGHRRFGNVRKLRRAGSRSATPVRTAGCGPGRRRTSASRCGESACAHRGADDLGRVDRSRAKQGQARRLCRDLDNRAPGLRPRTMDLYRWLLKKHIAPYLGGVPIGKMSTAMIRQWRAKLLGDGVSVSMAAKAYRLLRAVLMTAVEEDKILPRNPCRVRGAGDEDAPERPVLTVAQVFELAELVGRRPVGNIRKLPACGYRLRFRRHGEMRTSPRSTAREPKPSERCGRWPMTAGPTATMTGVTWRSSCWPPSPACDGAK